MNSKDPTGHSTVAGDDNGNAVPDYLEIKWFRMTIRAKKLLSASMFTVNARKKGVAVDCKVRFKDFEVTKANGEKRNMLENRLFLYAVCKEIEEGVRKKERECIQEGNTLAGSMSFKHIYQELSYHYLGYKTFSEGSSFYKRCEEADLNYDEDRPLCYPMYLISVPTIVPGIITYEFP